ncbi:hypothetical protein [Chelativorans sp. YIM 93263]|uniref:hypothetical protein n=1 Tax=Chelativorans sp. YIM 93263 TaxID=2906648 RepID=UPI002378F11D|nr:hypothetical protein [Chelativorans sp. YIM 93263]
MKALFKPASFAALASLLVVAGCVSGVPRSAESTVEGRWSDPQGISVSSFNDGQFVTIANDTGNRLSEGTYRFRDSRTIDIAMRSLVRQTNVQVTCEMVGQSQLNCTNTQGQNFVLTRS